MVQIREAAEADATSLSVLLEELGHPLDPPAVVTQLRELRGLGPRCGTFVAVEGADVVGVVSAFAAPVLHRPLPVGRISVMVVSAGLTGRGIGTALLRYAESFLVRRGCARIEVTSAAHRTDAHRFYLDRGYAQQGVRFARELGPET